MNGLPSVLKGIAAMVIAQLALLLNDTFVKLASEALPIGEIIFLRGLLAALLIAVAAAALGALGGLKHLNHRTVYWRVIGELGGTAFFLLALIHMPIANAIIIFQAVPLAVTAGAALVLGERVGWRRWLAIGVGFLGVTVVVRPGLAGFDVYAVFVLISVLFVAFRDLSTRAMPPAVPALLLTQVTAISVTLLGAGMGIAPALGLGAEWIWPSPLQWLWLATAAVFLSAGYIAIVLALRLGDISAIAPFRYVAVVFAIIVGYVVWGDMPDALTILGSAIIIAAGLYTLYRESTRRGAAPLAARAAMPPPR